MKFSPHEKRRFAGGVAWSAVDSWYTQLANLAMLIILAKYYLPASELGVIALAQAFVVFLQYFAGQGLGNALVQQQDLTDAHKNAALWLNLGLGFVLVVLSCALAPVMAQFFGEPNLDVIIPALSSCLLINAISTVPEALLRRQLQFKQLAIRQVVGTTAGLVVALAVAFYGGGVWALVWYQVVQTATKSVVLWIESAWRPRLMLDRTAITELAPFAVSMLGINVVTFANRRSDVLLIGRYVGMEALGYYNLATRMTQAIVNLLTSVIMKVSFPALAGLKGDKHKLSYGVYTLTHVTAVVAAPAFGGVALLSEEFISALFGAEWGNAAPIVSIVAWLGAIQSIQSVNMTILLSLGRPQWNFQFYAAQTFVTLVAFFLVYQDGITAIALMYLLVVGLCYPASIFMIKRAIPEFSIAKYLAALLTPAVALFLAGGALMLFKAGHPGIFPRGMAIIALVLFYLGYATVCFSLEFNRALALCRTLLGVIKSRLSSGRQLKKENLYRG